MSDADDQLGGSGGEYGRRPEDMVPGKDNAAPGGSGKDAQQAKDSQNGPDEGTEDSFPASDPPANY